MRGVSPRRWISFAGLDVVRCEDSRFRVIEDQVRMPSGIAYAVAMRETLRDLLAVEPPQPDVSLVFGELALAFQDAAPPGVDEPRMVTLSEGPSAAAWWEHQRLARELCAPVVSLADLVVKPRGEMGGEGVVLWRDADEETRESVRERIAAEPGGWIGQQLVQLSVH